MKILKIVTVAAVVAVVVVSTAVLSTKSDEDQQDEVNSDRSGLVYGSVVPDENGNYTDDGSSGGATTDSSTKGPGGLIEDVATSIDPESEATPKKLPSSSKRIGDAVGRDGSVLVVTTSEPTIEWGHIELNDCAGVLYEAQKPYELETETSTRIVQADNPTITSMCTATYQNYTDGNSLSLGIVTLISDEEAIDRYNNIRFSFDVNDISYDALSSEDGDRLTGTVDDDQIGEIIILRIGSTVVTVNNGPVGSRSPWTSEFMRETAYSVFERLPTT